MYTRVMTNAIGDILSKRQPKEPEEFGVIRDFVQKKLSVTPKVQLNGDVYIVTMPSAAAASGLQPEIYRLRNIIKTKRRIQIRIG